MCRTPFRAELQFLSHLSTSLTTVGWSCLTNQRTDKLDGSQGEKLEGEVRIVRVIFLQVKGREMCLNRQCSSEAISWKAVMLTYKDCV